MTWGALVDVALNTATILINTAPIPGVAKDAAMLVLEQAKKGLHEELAPNVELTGAADGKPGVLTDTRKKPE